MSERERIINSINESMFRDEDKGCVRPSEIADWHMKEVARIVEPLKKEYTDEERDTYGSYNLLYEDVQETLKRARGGENGR